MCAKLSQYVLLAGKYASLVVVAVEITFILACHHNPRACMIVAVLQNWLIDAMHAG
jgi:hypothetical protein